MLIIIVNHDCKARNHYLNNYWLRFLVSYSITRPRWVHETHYHFLWWNARCNEPTRHWLVEIKWLISAGWFTSLSFRWGLVTIYATLWPKRYFPLSLQQNSWQFADDICKCIFLLESDICIYQYLLQFICKGPVDKNGICSVLSLVWLHLIKTKTCIKLNFPSPYSLEILFLFHLEISWWHFKQCLFYRQIIYTFEVLMWPVSMMHGWHASLMTDHC